STNGDSETFRRLMTPIVATKQPFAAISLWRTGSEARRPLAVVGAQPELASKSPALIRAVLDRAKGNGTLAVNNLLAATDRCLGYAYKTSPHSRFVVYAEAALPKQRR